MCGLGCAGQRNVSGHSDFATGFLHSHLPANVLVRTILAAIAHLLRCLGNKYRLMPASGRKQPLGC